MVASYIGNIGAMIMAAGSSQRFGQSKQLALFKGKSLVRNAVETAIDTGLKHVICITGHEYELIKTEVHDLECEVIFNKDFKEGIGASIRNGLKSLMRNVSGLQAVLIIHADQPLISSGLLSNIIGKYEPLKSTIVAASYAGTVGVPVLIDKAYFLEFTKLKGDEGGKKVLIRYAKKIIAVPFPDGAFDIDTKEDLENT